MENSWQNDFLPRPFWARILVLCAYLALSVAALFILARIIPAASPFIVAWIVAWALSRPIEWISARTRIRRGIIAAGVTAFVIAVLGFVLFRLGNLLISEAGGIVEALGINASDIGKRMTDMTRSLGEKFPALDGIGGGGAIENGINELISGIISHVTSFIGKLAAGIVKSVPSALLFVIVTVVASFYFTCGYDSIKRSFCRMIPGRGADRIRSFVRSGADMIKFYLRANLIICAVTFGILFFGFTVLKFKYVALTALIIAIVDFLPVFGVGIALIPWSVFELIGSDYASGFGLLILYFCCALARQLLEPRLISEKVGLHPAATLAAMYLGFRFMGILGMLFLPLAVTLAAGAAKRRDIPK